MYKVQSAKQTIVICVFCTLVYYIDEIMVLVLVIF